MRVHATIFEKLAHLTTICSGYGATLKMVPHKKN